MATAIRKCKVCGKPYEYCHTNRRNGFRWQDVACSPEHGSIYLARIQESRSKNKEENEIQPEPVEKVISPETVEPEETDEVIANVLYDLIEDEEYDDDEEELDDEYDDESEIEE